MKRVALLLASTLCALPAIASERTDLPPPAQVAAVLDSHPSVAAAVSRIDAAKAEARMLKSGSHEFLASGSYIRRSVDREGGFDEFDGTVSRPIRLPGKAALDKKAGALGIEIAQNQQEDVRHHTALMLSDQWHDWQLASAVARLDADAVATYERELQAISRRVEVRDASQLEADQVSAALGLARAQLADSIATRDQARSMLAATFPTLPLPPEAPTLATPQLPELSVEQLRKLVIERSHEIRAAVRQADRLSVLGERARQDRVPDPTIGVRLFSERSGMERGAGVVASIPLGGGYRRAASDQASAQASAARSEAAVVMREIQATADADAIAVRARLDAWDAAAKATENAGGAAQRTARGYQLGATDLTDLLFARRQAIEAAKAEAKARAEALRAIMRISIDSHTIWAPDGD